MALESDADLCLLDGLLPVSSVFWPLFSICISPFINTCLYTIPSSVFFSCSLKRLPWVLFEILDLLFLLFILLWWPIQFNWHSDKSISKSPNSYINSLLYHFLQFSFTLIPPHICLKTFLSTVACHLVTSSFSIQDSAPHVATGLINVLQIFFF